jgi:hypothetical protein
LVLPITTYTLSSTKLEISAKYFCLVARGWGDKGRCRGKGEEMTQILYAHMNKIKKKKRRD